MKKLLGILAVSGIFLASCSSDGDDPPPDNNNNMNGGTELTYAGSIRGIINSNCTGCHGNPPSQGAPMSLTTYSDVRGAVETRNLLGRINDANNPMPPTGLLPNDTRQLIEDWVDLGMPEN